MLISYYILLFKANGFPFCYLELFDKLKKRICVIVVPSLTTSLEPLAHLRGFSVTIPRCYMDVYVNNFFPRTARVWNSASIESFPLTNDLGGLGV